MLCNILSMTPQYNQCGYGGFPFWIFAVALCLGTMHPTEIVIAVVGGLNWLLFFLLIPEFLRLLLPLLKLAHNFVIAVT